MKKVLLDTNIVLDIALERIPFFTKAKDVLTLLYQDSIPTFISATTVTDIYYILRKDKGHELTITFLKDFFTFVDIAGVDKYTVIDALHSEMGDFEDAIQVETAQQHEISVIITRNKNDFKSSNLEVYTPDEYLNLN